ncbi:MAG: hypothetical protein ACTSRK_15125 [Promethearchaeota archaeon]
MKNKHYLRNLNLKKTMRVNAISNILFLLILLLNLGYEVGRNFSGIDINNSFQEDLWITSIILSILALMFKNVLQTIVNEKFLNDNDENFSALLVYGINYEKIKKNLLFRSLFYSASIGLILILCPLLCYLASIVGSATEMILRPTLQIYSIYLLLDIVIQVISFWKLMNIYFNRLYPKDEIFDEESRFYKELTNKRTLLLKSIRHVLFLLVILGVFIFSLVIMSQNILLANRNLELLYMGFIIFNFCLILVLPIPFSQTFNLVYSYIINSSKKMSKWFYQNKKDKSVDMIKDYSTVKNIFKTKPWKMSKLKVFFMVFSIILMFNGLTTIQFHMEEIKVKNMLYYDDSDVEIKMIIDLFIRNTTDSDKYIENYVNSSFFEDFSVIEYGNAYQIQLFNPQEEFYIFDTYQCIYLNTSNYLRYVDSNNINVEATLQDRNIETILSEFDNESVIISSAFAKNMQISINDTLSFAPKTNKEYTIEKQFRVVAILNFAPLLHLDEVVSQDTPIMLSFTPFLVFSTSLSDRDFRVINIYARIPQKYTTQAREVDNFFLLNQSVEYFHVNTNIPESLQFTTNTRFYFLISLFPLPFLIFFFNLYLEEYFSKRKKIFSDLNYLGCAKSEVEKMQNKDVISHFSAVYWISVSVGIFTGFCLHNLYLLIDYLQYPISSEFSIPEFLDKLQRSRYYYLHYLGKFMQIDFKIGWILLVFTLLYLISIFFFHQKISRRYSLFNYHKKQN